jgi:Ca2+-binding RTX toxin-like protein
LESDEFSEISMGDGANTVIGGPGRDYLRGGDGPDTIFGVPATTGSRPGTAPIRFGAGGVPTGSSTSPRSRNR